METNNTNTPTNNTTNTPSDNNQQQSTHEVTAKQLKRQRIRQLIVSMIGVAILVWGIVKIGCMDYKSNEKSDDAQVEQYISPVNMRASGYIKKIYFKEHQNVKKGDTLLVLDDREYRIRVMEAEAALKDAMAGANVIDASVQTTQTSATVYEASIAEIEVRLAKLEKDRQRYQNLVARNAALPTPRRRSSMPCAVSRRRHIRESTKCRHARRTPLPPSNGHRQLWRWQS